MASSEIDIFRAADHLSRFSELHDQMQESRRIHGFNTETVVTDSGLFEINDASTKAMGKLATTAYADLVAADAKATADGILKVRTELAEITQQEVQVQKG